jgi:hypothetical protein
MVLNDVYLGEGSGRRLDSFEFRSRLLTKAAVEATSGTHQRVNRFRGTLLGKLPAPLPEHYVLGFDDQAFDVDSADYTKYLHGELRKGPGWWYYYLYCVLVKSPVGTLLLVALSVFAAIFFRAFRTSLLGEAALVLPIVVLFGLMSSQTGLNSHLRYVLPVYPFVFVFAGRLGRFWETSGSWGRMLLLLPIGANAVSVVSVHPHYLTYFNEVAGGPRHGIDHLADSNIDWGQGLIALKDWLAQHPSKQKLQLAYFGTMYPEVLGIDYQLPLFGPEAFGDSISKLDPQAIGPAPGLQAVGANYLLGISFPAPNAHGGQSHVPENAFRYYRRFKPVAIPGNSMYVYDLQLAEVNEVRRELGLPPWPGPESDGSSSGSPSQEH